jgi:hypothetical protein
MASNRTLNVPPIAIGNSVANLLNCGVTSLSGPVGMTVSQPYLVLNHVRITNKTGGAVTVTLYKGATGGSAAGTEWAFQGVSIPANSYVDWYGKARFDSGDFLTGVAGSASALTMTVEGEVGLS